MMAVIVAAVLVAVLVLFGAVVIKTAVNMMERI